MPDATIHSVTDGVEVTISIAGRFNYSVHREFRDAYERAEEQNNRYVIDLRGTEYMDSSALGMLLLLREHAGGDRADIRIINCSPAIQDILSIANFHRLFEIA